MFRYGLGTIYLKQEKFQVCASLSARVQLSLEQLAEYHFRRALEINPRNSVLHCYLGMALLSSSCYDDAIAVLNVS